MTLLNLFVKNFSSTGKSSCLHPRRYFAFSSGTLQQRAQQTQPSNKPNVVLIDAVRTPFVLSNTVFRELLAVDLQRHALKGLYFEK